MLVSSRIPFFYLSPFPPSWTKQSKQDDLASENVLFLLPLSFSPKIPFWLPLFMPTALARCIHFSTNVNKMIATAGVL
jgi:hypothetical protein